MPRPDSSSPLPAAAVAAAAAPRPAPPARSDAQSPASARWPARRLCVWAFVAAIALLPLLPVPAFWITQLNYIGLYALPAMGLVLLTGVGGFTSFGQAAFVGIGAYTTAYLSTALGLSPWLNLFVGLALTCASALVLGWITLRMSGHYLPLATIAWCLALNYTMANMEWLGKFDGILGVPALQFAGIDFTQDSRIYYVIWALALLCAFALINLLDSRTGRAIRALKGGVTMAEAMGISTFRYKVQIFVCLLYTSPSPRDRQKSRMPSSA